MAMCYEPELESVLSLEVYNKVVVAWKAISLKRRCIPVTHNFSLSEEYELPFMEGRILMCQQYFLWLYAVYYFLNWFYEHSLPRRKIVDPALLRVTGRLVLTADVV
jgi:hypothetical protein